ncbi:MAG: SAM-dependent DNA methyltransferase [Azoarcus sp.]|jgi:hypothetical protein|nr:SAM-dependent DNA methyltransferase [Azoarcus sp.]
MPAGRQIKSKKRVADHGEVFTAEREVNAMLDLVKGETERIESSFLEPACGDGNFLAEILRRKLAAVKKKYGGSLLLPDYEMWSVVAVMNVYGVELLADNAAACRERLFRIWKDAYRANCKFDADDECQSAIRYILERNILCGDALTLKQAGGAPIIFAEWSFVSGTKVKRRDFRLDEMLSEHPVNRDFFWEYDEEIRAYLPKPIKEYPLIDYRRVQEHG